VTLLAWRVAVSFQDGVDKRPHRPYRRPLTSTPLARWRLGTRQRLTHHPPVYPQLAGYPLNRSDAELVLPSYLLE